MRAFLALLFVYLPSLAFAQGQWIADSRTGCKVFSIANSQPNETITWSGPCVNGFANGRGVLQWFTDGKPSLRVEGSFVNGKQHGRSVITAARGIKFEGNFVHGKRHGRGIFTMINGDRYERNYINGNAHGSDVYTWANGDRFEGNWANGKPHGFGTLTYANGTTYSGRWSNGCFQQGGRRAWIGTTEAQCGFK